MKLQDAKSYLIANQIWIYMIIALFLLGWLALSMYGQRKHQEGYNLCQGEYQSAEKKAKTDSAKKNLEIDEEYADDLHKIDSQPDSGYGVGPISDDVLTGMWRKRNKIYHRE